MKLFKTKAEKELSALRASARAIWRMRRDVLPPEDANALIESAKGDDEEAIRSAIDRAGPLFRNSFCENVEVLLVAVSVAMAFRCYFFQPFKIPTGSMQPTVYGIHSETCPPTFWDKPGLAQLCWLATGSMHTTVRTLGGYFSEARNDVKPGYATYIIGGNLHHVPVDAINDVNMTLVRNRTKDGRILPCTLWQGRIKTGDHVFVNRIVWNFRRPRRGEILVFATRNIPGLPGGTHYIKRIAGMPNETIAIDAPDLIVNGERHTGREYINAGELATAKDSFTTNADQYFALGDNTRNSLDSRYWGAVPERNILGPAFLVYWPFTSPRFGRMR